MVNRKLLWMLYGLAAIALVTAPRAGAWTNEHKTTYLTFSHPLSLPGVTLGSGTYIFEIANPSSGADIVRVMSRDRSIAYFMAFTAVGGQTIGKMATHIRVVTDSLGPLDPATAARRTSAS